MLPWPDGRPAKPQQDGNQVNSLCVPVNPMRRAGRSTYPIMIGDNATKRRR
jgi:hypothetical protein